MLSTKTLISTLIMASTIANASAIADNATLTFTNNTDRWLLIANSEHNEQGILVMLPPHRTMQTTGKASTSLNAILYADFENANASAGVTFYCSKKTIQLHSKFPINIAFPNDFIAIDEKDVKDARSNLNWAMSRFWPSRQQKTKSPYDYESLYYLGLL